MNIKIYGSELNRMMKTISQCIDAKDKENKSNIEILHEDNVLTIRSTNGVYSAVMTTPVLGGDGERFCVDGAMFAKVCAMCNGEITLITDGKTCTVKGVGRTKLFLVNANIPAAEKVEGKTVTVSAENFTRCFNHVAYAIASDLSRVQLTGVLTEADGGVLKMTTLDGFQMSMDETVCEGDSIKAIIPGSFMKLICSGLYGGDELKLTIDEHFVQAETEGMLLRCSQLSGEFPDCGRIVPQEFKTMSKVNAATVRDALKAGNVVNSRQNLVKLEVGENSISFRNNSEQAEFEADVPCETQGPGLNIAFNDKYLMNAMSALDTDDAVMHFNASTAPMVVKTTDGKGIRLVLPVRVMQ